MREHRHMDESTRGTPTAEVRPGMNDAELWFLLLGEGYGEPN
jgi:hypothetical protein